MTAPGAVDGDAFRAVLRRFATGVTIVTTLFEDKPKGFTANAFASVSAEPPMVLVCVNRTARSHPMISTAGFFCVNVLALEQQELAERFADRKAAEPFMDVAISRARTGAPVIEASLGYLDCELAEEHSAGTHTIFLGTVVACGFRSGVPLGYFNGGYRDFGCRIP